MSSRYSKPLDAIRSQHARLILQVLLLVAVVFFFCYSVLRSEWIGVPSITFVFIILITINIIRNVEKSNRDFAQFLTNISHNDFASSSGSSQQAFGAADFITAQKTLLSKFRKLKADRSAQYEYLHMVVEHVDTALICFDESEKIEFINSAAFRLLRKKFITSLKSIASLSPELADTLKDIPAGESVVVKVVINNELHQLILSATEFVLLEKKYKLVSLQNIKHALDEREIESWQKLIKVLTHEIMNSMTPIVSLSRYIEGVVNDVELSKKMLEPDSEQYRDLQLSCDAIASRSQGLMEFVDSYRSLSNLPEPTFAETNINELFERIELLLKDKIKERGIDFSLGVETEKPILPADVRLLEQVLLNLINNAIDAVAEEEKPRIELLYSELENGKSTIRVTDNGCGISRDDIENVFTPFYTTKEHGSGIGLSLSRQLTKLNRGTLSVSSLEGQGSEFTLTF